ncbi:hypothetical protein [Desulforamulus profundi]|uniref:hypothetical protein n=1 Tax=Desulforamulus profundi TaxID=1383067 RepID=UPI003083790F
MSINLAWEKFITTRDEEARQKLIIHHLPLVKHLAGRVAVKLPALIQREDLESYGVIGLMEHWTNMTLPWGTALIPMPTTA